MAETVVLAELSIDATGVVSGIAVTNNAMVGLGRTTEEVGRKVTRSSSFLDLVTRRMFNLRSAAVALLGGFTLGGIVVQLGALARNLITGTDWWRNFSNAIENTWLSLTKGQTALQGIARSLDSAFGGAAGAGPADFVAKLNEIKTAMKGLATAQQEAQGFNWLQRLFGTTLSSGRQMTPANPVDARQQTAMLEILQAGWRQLGASVDAITADLAKRLDITKAKARELIQIFMEMPLPARPDPTTRDVGTFLGLPSPEAIEDYNRVVHFGLNRLGADFTAGRINAVQFGNSLSLVVKAAIGSGGVQDALEIASRGMGTLESVLGTQGDAVRVLYLEYVRLRQALIEAGATAEQIKAFERLTGAQVRFVGSLREAMRGLAETLTPAKLAFDSIMVAVNAFVGAMVQWAQGGTLTMRQFFSTMLIGIGQSLLAWGALAVVAAAFGYGPGAAAGWIAIAAGVAALAAARALGGGSGQASSSGSGATAAAGTAAPSRGSRTTHFTLEGSVIGLGLSKDDFVRWVNEQLALAEDDNA